MFEIRDLVELLDPKTIERICVQHRIAKGPAAKRRVALAATYDGEHRKLFKDLQKPELVSLLRTPTEIRGRRWLLLNGPSYTKLQLINRAMAIFVRMEVRKGFHAEDSLGGEEPTEDTNDEFDDEDEDEAGEAKWTPSPSTAFGALRPDVAMVVCRDRAGGYNISLLTPDLAGRLDQLSTPDGRIDLLFEGRPVAALTAVEDELVAALRAIHEAARAG